MLTKRATSVSASASQIGIPFAIPARLAIEGTEDHARYRSPRKQPHQQTSCDRQRTGALRRVNAVLSSEPAMASSTHGHRRRLHKRRLIESPGGGSAERLPGRRDRKAIQRFGDLHVFAFRVRRPSVCRSRLCREQPISSEVVIRRLTENQLGTKGGRISCPGRFRDEASTT
jgi:hypothetical protein